MKEETALAEERTENKALTRRKFIVGAGALATGILAAGIAGCSTDTGTPGTDKPAAGGIAQGEAAELPWTYQKLDVELVRKRGYENYFKGGCDYAAASALLTTLKETAGGPWGSIPLGMFLYGAGGAYSWGTLCGALNGSLQVMSMAAAQHEKLGNELLGWYTEFPFPSDKHEAYCKVPKQITTVAKSPLCHVSVSTWANEAGAKINEKEKKDRCAKLSGDTAARAAELLNQALEGKIVLGYKVPDEYSHCMSCHQGPDSLLDNEQGKFNCAACHDDHTQKK
ncbi:MAG: split soret cytochrome c precursor [Firmicutes bacterium HGW-Firmicutes-14]|nr:MAG: split soret cytochrome c precursor [Firmicutes bacterium HGW-Firmicutes-14]